MSIDSSIEIWKNKNTQEIIGGRMKGAVPINDGDFLRNLIIDHYNNKWIVPIATSRFSLTNSMRTLGHLVNWREGKGKHFISFYQNKLKIKESKNICPKQLELIHEQCSHRILFEIIIIILLLFLAYYL